MPKLTKRPMCLYTVEMVPQQEKIKAACAEPAAWVSGEALFFCDEHFPRNLPMEVMKQLKVRALR